LLSFRTVDEISHKTFIVSYIVNTTYIVTHGEPWLAFFISKGGGRLKATEKELLKLLLVINDYRIRVGKRPFLLGKTVVARKLQRRHLYQLKHLNLKQGDVGTVSQYTPFVSGKLLLNFLSGLIEGVHIGMKLALIIEEVKPKEVGK
jgi:hypothetical protein